MRVKLDRSVEKRVRYYSFELLETLFGDYLLLKKYGNIKNKKPTRIITKYYSSLTDAKEAYFKHLKKKLKKGYIIKSSIHY